MTAVLRVVLYTGNYNYIKDGVSLTLNRLVAFLLHHNVEVLVVAPTGPKPALPHEGELIAVPSFPVPFRPEYRIALGLPASVKIAIADFRPNLFHIAVPDIAGHRVLRLAEAWNIPAVASYHTRFDNYLQHYNFGILAPLVTRLLRNFYNRCQHTYPPSQSMADMLRHDGITGNMRIWSRGIDRSRFNPGKRDMAWRRGLGIVDDEIVIAFAGRLVKEKNTSLLMRVLATLEGRGNRCRGLIIGDGPEAQVMKAAKTRTVFSGLLHGDDVARAYASSDLFLFPSESETFGNVTLEAIASGLAAICADATGSRSIVTDGVNGFLVPAGNEMDFVAHAEELIRSPELRTNMRAAALERAREFDWEVINKSLLANYHAAVAEYATRHGPARLP